MPKIFKQTDMTLIRQILIDKGRDMFTRYGLKKTTIADLTRAAGIAQGTFYAFFESKEALYFEILELEQQKIQDKFSETMAASAKFTVQSFKKLLSTAFEMAEENEFIKHMYLEEEYETLLRKIPKDKLEAHIRKDSETVDALFGQLRNEGILIDREPRIISGVFRSLFLLTLHKKEIGDDIYKDTMNLLIELIASGLVKEGGSIND